MGPILTALRPALLPAAAALGGLAAGIGGTLGFQKWRNRPARQAEPPKPSKPRVVETTPAETAA